MCGGVHQKRVNIKRAVAMAVNIPSCSTAIMAAKSMLQIALRIIDILTSTCAGSFTSKWFALTQSRSLELHY